MNLPKWMHNASCKDKDRPKIQFLERSGRCVVKKGSNGVGAAYVQQHNLAKAGEE